MGIDSNVLVAAITILVTVLGSVWVASFNARRASERIALEANRAKKAEAYHAFMDVIKTMVKSKGDVKSLQQRQIISAFEEFTATVVIYGGPEVVLAFGKWRQNADNLHAVRLIDGILRAIRSDLGESNEGIAEQELFGLFVVGGRAALERGLLSK